MADADIKQFGFGLKVGGTGTDNTEVFANERMIKCMYFTGNADNATCALSTKDLGGTYVAIHAMKASDTNELNAACGNMIWFGELGQPFNGLQVNLSHASDILFIHFV